MFKDHPLRRQPRQTEVAEPLSITPLPPVDAQDRAWRKVTRFDRKAVTWAMPLPRLYRTPSAPKSAYLLLTADMVGTARRADFYEDGAGKLAIDLCETGEYKVGAQSRQRRLCIPATFSDLIPMGNTPVTLTRDLRGMLILDLSAIAAEAGK